MVIENKPGAGTNIAMRALIDAPADGYTLMVTANRLLPTRRCFSQRRSTRRRTSHRSRLIGRVPVVIAANTASPYGNVAQLIALQSRRPTA